VAESIWSSAPRFDLPLFLGAALVCAASSSLEFVGSRHFSHQPNLVVFFAAAVLLPPWALAPLALLCVGPGWSVRRPPWFLALFNVANYLIAGLVAHELVVLNATLRPGAGVTLSTVLALAAAVVAFVAVNHALIGAVVATAGGRGLRESVREHAAGTPLDCALASCGACLAALWHAQPPLTLLILGPILLVYSALSVPALRHKSRTDPKTGLFNSERLRELMDDALASAFKRRRPVAVVMLDLDHLRQANNRFGHLAGDRLICDVADILAEEVGSSGVAARFGGEEFCLLLPGMDLIEAEQLSDRIRGRIETTDWRLGGTDETYELTISAGVAAFPEHGDTIDDLLAAADAAVYDAKLGGRNRVRLALAAGARTTLHEEAAAPTAAFPAPRTALPPDPDDGELLLTLRPLTASEESAGGAEDAEPVAGPDARQGAPRSRRFMPLFLGVLAAGVLATLALCDTSAIAVDPALFGLLLLAVLVLDVAPIDIFERANTSPAAVFTLALAFVFGPAGPMAAEAIAAVTRVRRRDASERVLFDVFALGLAGTAAAYTWSAVATGSTASQVLAGGLSGLAYYLVNVLLLSVAMGLTEGQAPIAAWRERLAWLWPHYIAFGCLGGSFVAAERSVGPIALLMFVLPVLMLWVAQRQYVARSREGVSELRRSHSELQGANERLRALLEDNQRLLGRMHRSYLSTITSLARTIEAKDPYTSGHTERVANIAAVLAAELGFSEDAVRAVNVGAVIHDIGKIGVPDAILLKRGGLTDEERAEIQRHPEISSYIVADLELPAVVKQMVRNHHERFDGGGYPDGLIGEEIPLAARILTVADSLDAMISDRPYRKALPVEVALEEIERHAGSQFCPRVAEALRVCVTRDPALIVEIHEDLLPWIQANPKAAQDAVTAVSSG
jgi:diguanylate cyclase (GGDEF)-like protein